MCSLVRIQMDRVVYCIGLNSWKQNSLCHPLCKAYPYSCDCSKSEFDLKSEGRSWLVYPKDCSCRTTHRPPHHRLLFPVAIFLKRRLHRTNHFVWLKDGHW